MQILPRNYLPPTLEDFKQVEYFWGYEAIIEIIQNYSLEEEILEYLLISEIYTRFLIRYQKLDSKMLLFLLLQENLDSLEIEYIYRYQKLPSNIIRFCIQKKLVPDALLLYQNLTEEQIHELVLNLDSSVDDYRIQWIIKSLPTRYYPILLTHPSSCVRNLVKECLKF